MTNIENVTQRMRQFERLYERRMTSWKDAKEPYTWITPPRLLLTPG